MENSVTDNFDQDSSVMLDRIVNSIAKNVTLQMERIVAPLRERVDELEAQVPVQGKDGAEGPRGEKGNDGKDAEVDYEQISAIIKGLIPEPVTGPSGKDAEVDYDKVSAILKSLIPEPVSGPQGDVGMPGIKGQDGQNGQDGKDGSNGRDALELDILPFIEAEGSYVRGTFAKHRGGLWVCKNSRPGLDSWECVVEGVAEIGIEHGDDLRTFAFGAELSSGATVAKTFALPVILDRGIYKAGDTYAKGDAVTWNGNFCIAQKETTQEPLSLPGASEWRIAVKRGRDGKDGKDGPPGLPGNDGPRGRDLTHMGPNGEKYA